MEQKYTILKEVDTYVRRFKLHGRRITFKINDPPEDVPEYEWAEAAIKDVINQVKDECRPTDQIGFSSTAEFFRDSPGWIQFKPCKELKAQDVWDVIFSLFQSNSEDGIRAKDTLRFQVTRVGMPEGSGPRRTKFYSSFWEECLKRNGIVSIKNSDNLCLPRAIIVAKAQIKKNPEYKKIRDDIGKLQATKAKELMEKAGVIVPESGCGILELQKFQEHLKKYKITVYKYGTKGRDLIYDGVNPIAEHKINLLYHDGHYNVITSLTSAFACSYFCEDCRVPYSTRERHRCQKSCLACGGETPCIVEGNELKCEDCNRKFKNQQCFALHKTSKRCEWLKRCKECLKVLDIRKHKNKHVCGEIFCKICKMHMPANHKCYIRKDHRKPPKKDFLFVFYDLETRQEKSQCENEDIKIHEPNLCVVQQSCSECINKELPTNCEKCGIRQRVIKDLVIPRFLSHVLQKKKEFKSVTCIAHNGQGFDVQFILKYILEKTQYVPDLIMRGTKIIQLVIDNVRFIDSLNYFPMSLAKLPKAFKLSSAAKKGYFPHYFNIKENQTYVGKIPDKRFYGCDEMMTEEREKFIKWHEEQIENNYVFDMQKEIVDYCISDVNVLREACQQFRGYFLQECNVDPFLEAVTIASACNLAFRRNFLKQDTIGLIPSAGYRCRENQSKIALEWLFSEEKKRNIVIQHAGRTKEAILHGVKVDGFDTEKQEIYEFHGCYYHGCPKCFIHERNSPLRDDPLDSMSKRYERTLEKIERLLSLGYKVNEMWECQFRKEKENMPESKIISEASPLDPRDAFFGGRTGCTKMHYKVAENEKIEYVDVCSLYPWVCKYGKYPVGHPKIYVGEEDCEKLTGAEMDLTQVEGMIKCKILPPQNLYHPVLPVKQNGKLVFSLCQSCGEMENQSECEHEDEDRTLTGTWVVDEVKKAVSKGYKIQKIYEIWQYEVEQYDKNTLSGGLFTGFINKFLKIKQEASGFPADCSTQEEKEKYIEEYCNTEGVKLEFESIVNNPGLRSLAKLMLNSFWGRFGMRENMPKTSIVREPHEFFKLFSDPSIDVNTVQEVNEEVCVVNWEFKEEVRESSPSVNVVIAAYTTAQARLKLYEYLEALDRQVLYYDTDSVIYSYKEGEYKVKTGSFLGEMTDELEGYGPGSYITEFVSGGPKTYAYKVLTPGTGKISYLCKVKGLTLNFKACQIVNFEKLKEMIMRKEENEKVILKSTNILRTAEREVVTAPVSKTFQIKVTKRRVVENFDTEPYGFKRRKVE